jgi:hypothetical protein
MNAIKFLLATLVLTASLPLFAQTSPRFIDKSILVQSRVLPSDYQLFLPDTASQILFNPARAALGGRRFVYSSYLPASTTTPVPPVFSTPSFSGQSLVIASFFEVGEGKYVVQASHRAERNSFEETRSDFSQTRSVFSSDVSNSQGSSFTTQNSKLMPHTVLLSRVWDKGQSIGVYVIAEPSSASNNRNSLSTSQSMISSSFFSIKPHSYDFFIL